MGAEEKLQQRTAKLEAKCQNQAEWITNNLTKAKNCAIQMKQLEKTITKLRQSNKDLRNLLHNFKQENAKLQDRLKNAVIPKYKKGQLAWYIEENPYCNNKRQVFCGHITDITIHIWNGDNGKPVLYYKIDTSFLYIHEKEIFATEADAQKYLEES